MKLNSGKNRDSLQSGKVVCLNQCYFQLAANHSTAVAVGSPVVSPRRRDCALQGLPVQVRRQLRVGDGRRVRRAPPGGAAERRQGLGYRRRRRQHRRREGAASRREL